ncbi:cytochrome c biogenesis CcdA family protein [Cellulomonas chengniuliangii]|uniref:Cytochrome c biogenesis CcdA family protein n=1 Tax=Cellulomonas chengniuliangii TaxID=2968084 RepID=A0ABY5L5Z7_9CELL|nr:cytochrome c biogenesis CcdA family protein [Cellulomonas chengniuliangii]MCC2309537.1 cytochrome c biogenesis CcdA family protein [Cellulomonas chengniuliangii]UUI77032.1 cytochrome c biogenesis CcdA family protein [Cellulomonas chengniuliangii]
MALAVPVALLAGFVAFASPCVLPLVPGYLGYLGGMSGATVASPTAPRVLAPLGQPRTGRPSTDQPGAGQPGTGAAPADAAPAVDRRRLLTGVALFIAGFTFVFVALGVLAGSVGAALHDGQGVITRVLGVVVVLMGLAFMGFVPFLQQDRRVRVSPQAGLWGAPLLGLVFGLGWTPCIGPTLVAITALSLDGGSAGRGAVLSVAFCAGLGLPFLLIALGAARSRRALGFLRRHRLAVSRVGGGMLVVLGVALATGLWSSWSLWLQGLLTGSDVFVPVV